jgi:hypothetical protein
MPTTNAQNEQVIEAVVSGPDEANRLFTVTGNAQTTVQADDDINVETYTFLIGPMLAPGQFHRATASAAMTGYTVYNDAVPGWYGMDVLSVEADWDDETRRTEMRVEVRAQAGPGTRVTAGVIGFSATVLAAI